MSPVRSTDRYQPLSQYEISGNLLVLVLVARWESERPIGLLLQEVSPELTFLDYVGVRFVALTDINYTVNVLLSMHEIVAGSLELVEEGVCAMARDRGVRGGRVKWFDTAMVAHGYELADQGCPVCVLRTPQCPSDGAEFAARVERRAVGCALGQCLGRVNGMFDIPVARSHWPGTYTRANGVPPKLASDHPISLDEGKSEERGGTWLLA
ncbi:hypothetical protein An02g05310 [Aspergillus niger]|uniref:Uncharacterized protein n=2 Tax=Aspergillus niger TaxID=5061 RepID=A2QCZ7_ASPNC|nr:hypothetical protein An02g05310 [Aspergillus niger]CAK37637.1 hypothetical protein An02g05310 [Aspergillus niger]